MLAYRLTGCEHELAATANPYYDVQRFGLSIVASPRHADILLVTGAVTTRMAEPLRADLGAFVGKKGFNLD